MKSSSERISRTGKQIKKCSDNRIMVELSSEEGPDGVRRRKKKVRGGESDEESVYDYVSYFPLDFSILQCKNNQVL